MANSITVQAAYSQLCVLAFGITTVKKQPRPPFGINDQSRLGEYAGDCADRAYAWRNAEGFDACDQALIDTAHTAINAAVALMYTIAYNTSNTLTTDVIYKQIDDALTAVDVCLSALTVSV